MRAKTLFSITAMLTASMLTAPAVLADDSLAAKLAPQRSIVYLRGLIDLEKLKDSNLDHYTRAQRIMADADQICAPGPSETYYAAWAAKDVRCQGMRLRTSLPAKREIGFTLDGVRYIALVEQSNSPAQLRQVPGHLFEPTN